MPHHPRTQDPATYVASLAAAETDARRIADLLTETLDSANAICSVFARPRGGWQVEVHFSAPLHTKALRDAFALAAGRNRAKALRIARAPARDWIAASLAALPPVHAGRFIVHGAHDRKRVPINRIGIEIEAALAFGTGHHGTTRGCLLAIDRLAKTRQKNSTRTALKILDLGTGSGVLAIAAAKSLRTRVLATDIDLRAVRTARANAINNHVNNYVETLHAAGLNAPHLRRHARFDLVLANVLLKPLLKLAAPITARLAPRACVVLSGLLSAQANAAIVAYRAQGLSLERRLVLDGWTTLVMARRTAAPR